MTRRTVIIVGGIVALLFAVALYIQQTSQRESPTLPAFASYPAGDLYRGRPAEVDFSTHPAAEEFRTEILSGVSEGVNFAGHYTVISWSCGTNCQNSAIVDVKTGNIVVYGILSAYGALFQSDSKLLVVNPLEHVPPSTLAEMKEYPGVHYPLGSMPAASDYYVFENDTLTFIGRYGMKSKEEHSCKQAVSPARNPFTEEVREFPTPCSIPFGWDALETAEGV